VSGASIVEILDGIIGNRPTVVKIDIEGAEELVVGSMLHWLRRPQVKKVIVEVDDEFLHRFGGSARSLYSTLTGLGFTPQRGVGAAKHYNEVFIRTGPDRAAQPEADHHAEGARALA
jgi:hypothetical protein